MRTNWPEIPLEQLCTRVTVGHVGPMQQEYREGGVPFLRSMNVAPFTIDPQDLKRVSEDFHTKLKKSALRPGDVVVVRTGYPGTAAAMPETIPVANCADLVVVTPGADLMAEYLVAVLNSPWGKAAVRGRLVGAAQQHFNVTIAKQLPIPTPPLSIQRKLVSVLVAYQDLINNNERRVEILEEKAKAIYGEWFVDLRFPHHQLAQFVESSAGVIPEGWEVAAIEDIADLFRKNVNPMKFPQEGFDHFSFEAFDKDRVPDQTMGSTLRAGKFLVDGDCVLLAKLNPRIPRVWLARPGSERRSIASSELLVFRHKPGASNEYLYLTMSSDQFRDRLIGLAGGTSTSHQRVKPQDLVSLHVLKPSPDVLDSFTQLVRPVFALAHTLRITNRNLRATRDLLLPKLISGDVDVANLDIDTSRLAA